MAEDALGGGGPDAGMTGGAALPLGGVCATTSTGSPKKVASATFDIYHERQVGQYCGLHAVNNMLQRRAFEPDELTAIQADVSAVQEALETWSFARLTGSLCRCARGGYMDDFNVQTLEIALNQQGMGMQWFDRRRELRDLRLQDATLVGLIMNVYQDGEKRSCLPGTAKQHWQCIRRVMGTYFNLDSHLEEPKRIGNAEALSKYLSLALKDRHSVVFRVMHAPNLK